MVIGSPPGWCGGVAPVREVGQVGGGIEVACRLALAHEFGQGEGPVSGAWTRGCAASRAWMPKSAGLGVGLDVDFRHGASLLEQRPGATAGFR